ncbi:MAG TPA: Lrp/AsnC family transcriptional regulator [Thermomicrobiales bacterium]|nr:Lrp/AsnC family transcriptional regulator [Thermomicrobiales bacterium]
MTETDRAIIRLLQQDARVSYAEISRETGIPESTVRRRMERLQQRGVIEFAMLADPVRLGYDLRAMIGLKIDLRRLDEIAQALHDLNEVMFAAVLTGDFDITLHVVVRSQDELVDFLSHKLAPIDGIRSLETFVMPHIIKPATAWVLPETPPEPALDGLELEPEDEGVGATPREGAAHGRQHRRERPRKLHLARGAAE